MKYYEIERSSKIENCELLITDEDKTGTDICKMSDFFEIGINNNALRVLKDSSFDTIKRFSLSIISELNDCVKIIDSLIKKDNCELVADLTKLPKEIKDKLEKGKNIIDYSKQYSDRLRPVILDLNHKRQKDIVLKKVVRKADNESAFRNIATQQLLMQIYERIDELKELCLYQISLQKNDMVFKPFVKARSEILNYQTSNNDNERIEHLNNASGSLQDCIAGIYSCIKTDQDALIRNDKGKSHENPDKYIESICCDMLHLTKIVGLQSQVYTLLRKDNENENLINEYKYSINNIFNKPINEDDESLAILIHNWCAYKKDNNDAWLNMYDNINRLSIEKGYDHYDKELYYLDEEIINE